MFLDLLAVALIALMATDWICALILWRLDRDHPGIVALHERARTAAALAVAGTLAGGLGLARLARVMVGDAGVLILAIILVLVSVPSVVWVIRYLRGSFGDDE